MFAVVREGYWRSQKGLHMRLDDGKELVLHDQSNGVIKMGSFI